MRVLFRSQAGIKVRAIAETFGIDKKVVEQRLALGNLVPSARDLVRSGKRQMGWAQAMTVGSPASQERIVAEIDVNSAAHLDGSSVRVELTRGNIPVTSALFDRSEEHTSELQSLMRISYAGFCLKKKQQQQ